MNIRSLSPLTVLLALLASLLASVQAQLPLDPPLPTPGITHDASMPSFEEVMGHRPGERHARPEQIVDWFRAIAAASPRVQMGQQGRSHQGRPLVHAVVSSPANLKRLEEIRAAHVALRASGGQEPADYDGPAIVYMGYGVHGNETSAAEAAAMVLHHLAAGRGEAMDRMLEALVVLIVPNINPDGHDRFVDWVNGNRGGFATADPNDREHRSPWPSGRTNHYLFDLNRDWLLLVNSESRANVALWHRYSPVISTDYHEMGGSRPYFFQPGVAGRDNPMTPPVVRELTSNLAEACGLALDAVGEPWYSGESFDDFYYGKGSTYPDVNGAVGMLFEQGSSRGLRAETAWGPLNYGQTIRNQTATSIAVLQRAARDKQRYLNHKRDFYRTANEVAAKAGHAGWFLPSTGQEARAQRLVELLLAHQIVVHAAKPAGAGYVIPVKQPQARLLRSIMEPMLEYANTVFYDVTTWTMPMAYAVDTETLDAGRFSELAGAALKAAPEAKGELLGEDGGVGFFVHPEVGHATRSIVRLLRAGARVHFLPTSVAFADDEEGQARGVPAGSFYLPARQPGFEREELAQLVRDTVDADAIRVTAAPRGATSSGRGLGRPGHANVAEPKVLLVAGPSLSAYRVGELWHLLSHEWQMEVSLVDATRVAGLDLDRYTTLVMPSGGYAAWGEDTGRDIARWVSRGGTLIAFDRAADWVFARDMVPGKAVVRGRRGNVTTFAEADVQRSAERLAGAIFATRPDRTHPVAIGLPDVLPVFRLGRRSFEVPAQSNGRSLVLARYEAGPSQSILLSGWAPASAIEDLTGEASAIAHRVGSGKVFLFADALTFRGTWPGSARLIANAILRTRAF